MVVIVVMLFFHNPLQRWCR